MRSGSSTAPSSPSIGIVGPGTQLIDSISAPAAAPNGAANGFSVADTFLKSNTVDHRPRTPDTGPSRDTTRMTYDEMKLRVATIRAKALDLRRGGPDSTPVSQKELINLSKRIGNLTNIGRWGSPWDQQKDLAERETSQPLALAIENEKIIREASKIAAEFIRTRFRPGSQVTINYDKMTPGRTAEECAHTGWGSSLLFDRVISTGNVKAYWSYVHGQSLSGSPDAVADFVAQNSGIFRIAITGELTSDPTADALNMANLLDAHAADEEKAWMAANVDAVLSGQVPGGIK